MGASKVARDITAWKQQEAALKLANADLQQFAYAASHDLQEPLRTVTAYSQLLLEKNLGEPFGDRRKEFVRYIVEASLLACTICCAT